VSAPSAGSGPLAGVRIVELASIGPGPFAGQLLADLGAELIRLDRSGPGPGLGDAGWNPNLRGRPSVLVDLKHPEAAEVVLRLCERADALIEGFRPGVTERLGIGPDVALARNPRLVYGRMTGYGQDGPMSSVAGHDINYISLAGVLGAMKRPGERPLFPLNLVGDYGGGGMFLAFGVVCAILHARATGEGQVVDVSMVEGAASLATVFHGLISRGLWSTAEPGTNLLDSGAPFYEVYETADGRFMAVGAIEPQFYAELLRLLEIPAEEMPQYEQGRWPEFKERLAAIFRTRTRDQWTELFEGAEACTTPVLALDEAADHHHNRARGAFVEVGGIVQPAPAPRFSATPGAVRHGAPEPGSGTDEALAAWGLAEADIAALRAAGAVG
jgi:alpha-methylacyl-CoA racemase